MGIAKYWPYLIIKLLTETALFQHHIRRVAYSHSLITTYKQHWLNWHRHVVSKWNDNTSLSWHQQTLWPYRDCVSIQFGYSSTKLRISEVNSILFWDHTKRAQSVSSSVSYYTMEIGPYWSHFITKMVWERPHFHSILTETNRFWVCHI